MGLFTVSSGEVSIVFPMAEVFVDIKPQCAVVGARINSFENARFYAVACINGASRVRAYPRFSDVVPKRVQMTFRGVYPRVPPQYRQTTTTY